MEILDEIDRVWGGYSDFDNLDYVGWIIENDAREIRQSEWENAEKEAADIVICALRLLSERSDDPNEVITNRLNERMDGNQDEIIARDKQRYYGIQS